MLSIKIFSRNDAGKTHRRNLSSRSGCLDSAGLAHSVRNTALSTITPCLILVRRVAVVVHCRSRHSLLESRRGPTVLLCCIVICSV